MELKNHNLSGQPLKFVQEVRDLLTGMGDTTYRRLEIKGHNEKFIKGMCVKEYMEKKS